MPRWVDYPVVGNVNTSHISSALIPRRLSDDHEEQSIEPQGRLLTPRQLSLPPPPHLRLLHPSANETANNHDNIEPRSRSRKLDSLAYVPYEDNLAVLPEGATDDERQQNIILLEQKCRIVQEALAIGTRLPESAELARKRIEWLKKQIQKERDFLYACKLREVRTLSEKSKREELNHTFNEPIGKRARCGIADMPASRQTLRNVIDDCRTMNEQHWDEC